MNKDNNIHKNKLKALFDDFEQDVPIDGWSNLEKSLDATKRATIVRRNWYIGSAAAVAIILVAGLLFVNVPKPINDVPHITKAVAPKVEVDDYDISASSDNEKIIETPTVKLAHNRSSTTTLVKDDTYTLDSIIDETVIETAENEAEEVKASNEKKDKVEDRLNQDEIDVLIKELQEAANVNIFEDTDFQKNDNKPMMLAINARGGLTSSQKSSNSPMRLRSAGNYSSNLNEEDPKDAANNDLASGGISSILPETNTADNVAEMIHSQPYSFGITVSKWLTDKLSIETGLVYTYLYSESKNTSSVYADRENQELHYLGVPVNLNYNFLELGRFNLFTTIGGMIEKDVHGVNSINYTGTSKTFNTELESNNSNKINLKNPQLSVNAGVGVTYAIYGGANIYAKIGGAYYFDANNTEYKTIYSDKKLLLDINAGLRFQF